jgi:hypothetical protein
MAELESVVFTTPGGRILLATNRGVLSVPGLHTRSRAEGDRRSAANKVVQH